MDRRNFLTTTSALAMAHAVREATAANDVPSSTEPNITFGAAPGPAIAHNPVVSGPSPEAITILQPLARHATGHFEFAVANHDGDEPGDEKFQRVDAEAAGLLPLAEHVLKFRLPPLPAGKQIKYRVVARSIGWKQVREFVHGEIVAGPEEVGPTHTFRTLDPAADTTKFAVWNDTHENAETLSGLHGITAKLAPDFLLWNGDQSNDVHYPKDMAGQFLAPAGLAIADRWPLAYVRGNHDVRGPEARRLPDFTGTPEDRYYYAFRSGPVACLVMDTGEDKPDDSEHFGGMAAFQPMQRRQAEWLGQTIREPWFKDAPFKILFCHIPLWFTRDIFPTHQRWEAHSVGRDLWLPTLVDAGVQLVISGHTHDPRWMPAKEGQPIAQLIGGGPQPKWATHIEATATRKELVAKMTKLDGKVVAEAKFNS
jgi:acid phosphatase type 7